MPQIIAPIKVLREPAPNRIRWTRRQCDAMYDAEIITGRYELIGGEILSKMGQKPPHRITVILLRNWLIAVFGGLYVQSEATIDIGEADPEYNEPEPDAAVTLEPNTAYLDRHAGPEDLLLVAEVSDTTLRFDRTAKAALYARAGIREYWILDIAGRRIFVHRQPGPTGYREITAYSADEQIATLARPETDVRVSDLFPPLI